MNAIGHATHHAAIQRNPKSPEIPVLMAVTKHVMKSDMTQDITKENDMLAYLAGMRILGTGCWQRTL